MRAPALTPIPAAAGLIQRLLDENTLKRVRKQAQDAYLNIENRMSHITKRHGQCFHGGRRRQVRRLTNRSASRIQDGRRRLWLSRTTCTYASTDRSSSPPVPAAAAPAIRSRFSTSCSASTRRCAASTAKRLFPSTRAPGRSRIGGSRRRASRASSHAAAVALGLDPRQADDALELTFERRDGNVLLRTNLDRSPVLEVPEEELRAEWARFRDSFLAELRERAPSSSTGRPSRPCARRRTQPPGLLHDEGPPDASPAGPSRVVCSRVYGTVRRIGGTFGCCANSVFACWIAAGDAGAEALVPPAIGMPVRSPRTSAG